MLVFAINVASSKYDKLGLIAKLYDIITSIDNMKKKRNLRIFALILF